MSPTHSYSPRTPFHDHRRPQRSADTELTRVGSAALNTPTLNLSLQETDLLRRLAARINYGPADQPDRFCAEVKLAAESLPKRVRGELRSLSRKGSPTGIFVVRGLPLDRNLPKTPPDNSRHIGEMTLTARAQAILNHAVGKMVAFEAEGDGRLFQDVVPSLATTDSQTGLSSYPELEPHTEQAFSLLRSDWGSLACLKGARDAATYAMSARALTAALTKQERAQLRELLWTSEVSTSSCQKEECFGTTELRGPFAILYGSEDDPFLRFDKTLDWGISREAEDLRQRIIELFPRLRRSHTLSSGELLFIDNRRAIHGGSPFAARLDGSDRFVIKSFIGSAGGA